MASIQAPLKLIGHLGSPYSRKFRSYLRYKNIPFQWLRSMSEEAAALPKSKIPIIPALYFPEEKYKTGHTDSTPLIRTLDPVYSPSRAVLPDASSSGKVLPFLNNLVEDYTDEWMVKAMFHYRWKYDTQYNSKYLMLAVNPAMPKETADQLAAHFAARQIERLDRVVGVSDSTFHLVEKTYKSLLTVMDEILQESPFIFGEKPSSSDFAVFGQFSQLVQQDPTSKKLAEQTSERVKPWCDVVDDLSGFDPSDCDWLEIDEIGNSKAHRKLFYDISKIYLPFLRANTAAVINKEKEFSVELDGVEWRQNTFPYQARCWRLLESEFQALDEGDKQLVRELGLDF